MCANWLSILVTVSLIITASVIIIEIQNVPYWILVISSALWIVCFCTDALYTFRFGRELILKHEVNPIFRVLYSRIGVWSAFVHFSLEVTGITVLSLMIEYVSADSFDKTVLAMSAMIVLAGEHITAFFENRAFAQRI